MPQWRKPLRFLREAEFFFVLSGLLGSTCKRLYLFVYLLVFPIESIFDGPNVAHGFPVALSVKSRRASSFFVIKIVNALPSGAFSKWNHSFETYACSTICAPL